MAIFLNRIGSEKVNDPTPSRERTYFSELEFVEILAADLARPRPTKMSSLLMLKGRTGLQSA